MAINYPIALTPNGEATKVAGEFVVSRTKNSPAIHFPEAATAIAAFGRDPVKLAELLAAHDTLTLSLHDGVEGTVVLSLVVGHGAALACVELPSPGEYWVGMGALVAAKKAGFLPA